MSFVRLIGHPGWRYLVVNLPFHKSLEAGYQREAEPAPSRNLQLSLSFTGRDHAGLRFHVQLRRWFLEFNVCDNRHWDHTNGRWT